MPSDAITLFLVQPPNSPRLMNEGQKSAFVEPQQPRLYLCQESRHALSDLELLVVPFFEQMRSRVTNR